MSALIHPYTPLTDPAPNAPPRRWLRGNLHTHTTESDGVDTPQATVNWYAAHGYDFLALTDHNVRISHAGLDPQGLVLVAGEELTHPRSHVVGTGIDRTLPRGESLSEQLALIAAAGGVSLIAHPHWIGLTVEDILPLQGHLGIEIWNNKAENYLGKGDSVAWWDGLLTRGHRCWGLASDDCHDLGRDAGGGWLMVAAAERSWQAVRDALTAGCFYATQAPEYMRLGVEERTIRVHTSPCTEIRFVGTQGRVLYRACAPKQTTLQQAAFTLPAAEPYLRVEAVDAQGRRAWTQPFWSSAI